MILKTLNIPLFKSTSFFAMMLVLFSCAQQRPLIGGEKDEKPPKEVESFPKNGATNFKEKRIIIEFDEFIKLTNVSSQLIVSPLMENSPQVTVKGKKMIIDIDDELTPNTTYNLNFGNAISDITESNDTNYKYVFSTGPYIDSLSYSGAVVNAFDQSTKEKIYVLLYDQFEDSVPYKETPKYVAITDEKGQFVITNIANGKYKFFAINDINSNYFFDLPNEEIGFQNDFIALNESSSDNHIYLFKEESELQYVVKSEHKEYGKIDLILNKPTTKLTINPLNKTINEEFESWNVIESNKAGDSLTIWIYGAINEMEIKDGDNVIDTLEFEIIHKSELKDTLVKVTTNITSNFDLNKNIKIEINRPFTQYSSENILLYEDSILTANPSTTDIDIRKFELTYDFKENTNYQLFIPPNTFEDIYGLKNDTVKIDFKTKNESDYGIINLSLNTNFKENYILQLVKKNNLTNESYSSGNIQKKQYKHLSPGAYSLKLIIDTNGDGKWTTGHYLNGLQPEKVIFYEKEIIIRANWDNDINWTVKE